MQVKSTLQEKPGGIPLSPFLIPLYYTVRRKTKKGRERERWRDIERVE
jgi:hypothetical protein